MQNIYIYIKKELTEHGAEYLLLVAGGMCFLAALSAFQGQQGESLLVLALFVVFYIVWGVHHHLGARTLHIKNVLEYLLVGLIILTFSLILFANK
jgi:hypothetical protein